MSKRFVRWTGSFGRIRWWYDESSPSIGLTCLLVASLAFIVLVASAIAPQHIRPVPAVHLQPVAFDAEEPAEKETPSRAAAPETSDAPDQTSEQSAEAKGSPTETQEVSKPVEQPSSERDWSVGANALMSLVRLPRTEQDPLGLLREAGWTGFEIYTRDGWVRVMFDGTHALEKTPVDIGQVEWSAGYVAVLLAEAKRRGFQPIDRRVAPLDGDGNVRREFKRLGSAYLSARHIDPATVKRIDYRVVRKDGKWVFEVTGHN